jgi:uncharacterized protein (TIGR00369 family)
MTDDADAMAEEFDDLEGLLQRFLDENHEFLSWLGTGVEAVGDGTMTLSIPYDEKLTNARPSADPDERPDLHGGVAATLVDTVGGLALRTAVANPYDTRIATINLNVNYLRPATGDLVATADVVRIGGSVGVSEIVVESTTPDGHEREVAIGQGAYRVLRGE